MPINNLEITSDGSHSVHSSQFQALYHSKHGAIQESMHVFIESGLRHHEKSDLNVLEMGFGTGLNALLTLIEAKEKTKQIYYETIEAYPLDPAIARKLNYIDLLNASAYQADFLDLHDCQWNLSKDFKNFTFKKSLVKIQQAFFDLKFDLVYYDAFAPQTQEELWTPEIFTHIAQNLNDGAILVSYCAKGSFKRALISAGFTIEKIPGPPGKREMIRATYRT